MTFEFSTLILQPGSFLISDGTIGTFCESTRLIRRIFSKSSAMQPSFTSAAPNSDDTFYGLQETSIFNDALLAQGHEGSAATVWRERNLQVITEPHQQTIILSHTHTYD